MYETGISNVYVVLIRDGEEFLNNPKVKISEYTDNTVYEAELRGALNSLELSTDALYRDINYRICQLQRQQIIASQAMLQQQMEVLKDTKGRTLYSHTSGEIAEVHKCKRVLVKPRMNEEKCCEELAVWSGSGYKEPSFMKPISREITRLCTPRVCSQYNVPWYNIGTPMEEKWIKVENGEMVRTDRPQELSPLIHSKGGTTGH